ncbi:DUF2214 domain-containing protein [Ensifer adhaerens]|uniref:DUF2214 domain-containing protein n=1 Tax=Ensifer adhaerens TaxID=106592 RepID=UPI001CBCEDF2|nr:DUF2214 domain-containing protein [Ensifer adhaerens]MBZ7920791.1 DUF2214 domain-containing protein [Ensifer adhaerens]UAX93248.1 DUF2214 domain-containing protein [Ensifer adhaerens]UAY00885.1 DUF2214 domain-containing protein [Ensifer adhaerens]UAY08266.1 DUF2214 domain-containing protein [Ensifer adhaerens]
MSAADLVEWIAGWPVGVALRRSALLYLVVNAAHILAIGLLIGAILPLDLRLIGLVGQTPIAVLGPFLALAAVIGLVLAVLTGICLFSVRPSAYLANPAFLTKLALLALGTLNALTVRVSPGWSAALAGGAIAPRLRVQALGSLILWPSALLAGRWVGFVG